MIDTLQAYPEYKDPGVPWLGKVPKHWQVLRLKTMLREVDRRSATGQETLFSMTRQRGLVRYSDTTEKVHSARTLIGYKVCCAGEIVMNRMQAWSGMFHVAPDEGLVSPDYAVFSPQGEVSTVFLGHLLRSPRMVAKFRSESKGIGSGFLRLYGDRLGAIHVPLPPSSEQRKIERFIFAFDRQVRRFIRNRRRLIEVLNEQKQAIINHAVTRGLDPDVPLKPSGIDWIGDIPEHWETAPLKRLFRYAKGTRAAELTKEYVGTCPGEYPVYSGQTGKKGLLGQIDWHEFEFDSPVVFVTTVGARAMTTRLVQGKFSLSQNCALIIPRTGDVNVYFYELQMQILFEKERHRISLVMQPSLRFEDLNCFALACPPVEEQGHLVDYLQGMLKPTEVALDKAQREIDLILEYRTRLIADVVTGKVDVRHLAPPPGSEDLEETADELEPLDDAAGELDEEALTGEVSS